MMLTGGEAIGAFRERSDDRWIHGVWYRDGWLPYRLGPCSDSSFLDAPDGTESVTWDGEYLRVDRGGSPCYRVAVDWTMGRIRSGQSASTRPGPLGGTGLGCGSHGSGGIGPGTGGGGGIGGDGTCIGS